MYLQLGEILDTMHLENAVSISAILVHRVVKHCAIQIVVHQQMTPQLRGISFFYRAHSTIFTFLYFKNTWIGNCFGQFKGVEVPISRYDLSLLAQSRKKSLSLLIRQFNYNVYFFLNFIVFLMSKILPFRTKRFL